MEVSIRELKSHLSAVLRQVGAGETATITSHRKAVARLIPPAVKGEGIDHRLMAAGLMAECPLPGPLVRGALQPLPAGSGTVANAVLEDRGQ